MPKSIFPNFLLLFIFSLFLGSCTNKNPLLQNSFAEKSAAEILEIAKKIHEQAIVLDAHADIATPTIAANFLSADGLSKVDVSKLKAGGVSAVVLSVACLLYTSDAADE